MAVLEIRDIESRMQWKFSGAFQRINVYEVDTDPAVDAYIDPYTILEHLIAHIKDPEYDPATDPLPSGQNLRQQFTWGNPDTIGFADTGQLLKNADIKLRSVSQSRYLWSCVLTFDDFNQFTDADLFDFGEPATVPGGAGGGVQADQGGPFIKPSTPTEAGAKWSGSFFQVEEEVWWDQDLKVVQNSAYQPYPEQRIERTYDTIIVEFNTEQISLSQRKAAVNAYNSLAFWGFPEGEIRLMVWKYQLRHWFDSQQYIWNQMEFWVRDGLNNWKDMNLPDWSTAKLEQGDQRALVMEDEVGRQLPSTAVMLDGSGTPVDPALGVGYYNTFRFIKSFDFNDLTIPALPAAINP